MKIHLSKIEHKGSVRIKVLMPRVQKWIDKVKTVEGRKWSKTKNCWHLPYSKRSLAKMEQLFGSENLIYPKKVNLSKKEKPKFITYEKGGVITKRIIGDKIIVDKRKKNWLELFVPFDKKGWINCIKNIDGRNWDTERLIWLLPNVKMTFRQLKKHIGLENIIFNFTIDANIPEGFTVIEEKKKVKPTQFDLLNTQQQHMVVKLEEKLTLKRYSLWTIKAYKNHMIGLFHFQHKVLPENIGEKEVHDYLLYQIKKKRISESTQNQIINAYKAFAERVLKRPKEFIEIIRPKNPKKMPNVLSTEEVVAILEAPKNLKHKLALMLIYSAGLRRSELLNLKKKDISFQRRRIHIKGGKGKKDRYVVLAEAVIPYLKKYIRRYDPTNWLFEGQQGGKYSATSLQKIFERALNASGANTLASLHTLRHSYATHCVENGHNLKTIQSALGHGSLKTTEIYLHLSSEALKKLKSPLDSLESFK